MSYNKIKSIVFNDKEKTVFITSACNNVLPLLYGRSECIFYRELWEKKGKEAVELDIILAYCGGEYQPASIASYNKYYLASLQAYELGYSYDFDKREENRIIARAALRYVNNLPDQNCIIKFDNGGYLYKKTSTKYWTCWDAKTAQVFKNHLLATCMAPRTCKYEIITI